MNDNRITIKGVVNAVEWDNDEETTRVAILTNDDEEYLVADNKLGRELLDLETEEVRATGVVRESEYGEKTIVLSRYSVIEYEPSEYEEEEGEEEFDLWK